MSYQRNLVMHTDELRNTLKEYLRLSGKTAKEALEQKAHMLISGGGGGRGGKKVLGFWQEAHSHREEVVADINNAFRRFGHALRRKGRTRNSGEEISRRISLAGYYQSTGWFNVRYGKKRVNGQRVLRSQVPRGKVFANLHGSHMFIRFVNVTPGAKEYAEKTGYQLRAMANVTADMAVYIAKKQAQELQRRINAIKRVVALI